MYISLFALGLILGGIQLHNMHLLFLNKRFVCTPVVICVILRPV